MRCLFRTGEAYVTKLVWMGQIGACRFKFQIHFTLSRLSGTSGFYHASPGRLFPECDFFLIQ